MKHTLSNNCFLLSILAVLFLPSCIKEEIDLERIESFRWDPEIAVPLAHSSFTIADIVNKAGQPEELLIDPSTGLCSLIYRGELSSMTGAEFCKLSRLDFQSGYTLSASTAAIINSLPQGATFTADSSAALNFQTIDTIIIDEVTLSDGDFILKINSTISQDISVTVRIPEARKNGMVFEHSFQVPAAINGATSLQTDVDLSGYVIQPGQGGNTANALTCLFNFQFTKTSFNSSAGQNITIQNSLDGLRFSLIKGDVKQQKLFKIDNIESVDISVFENAVPGGGGFRINHVIAKLQIENALGIPLRVDSLMIKPSGDSLNLPFQFIPAPAGFLPLNILQPSLPGLVATTVPSQDIGGPNATELNAAINTKPKSLLYALEAMTNPGGPAAPNNRNFITDTGRVKIKMEVLMPLNGGAWDFTFRDTTPFDPGVDLTEYLESAQLRCIISNGFPFDVEMNIDFTDSAYNVLQTLQPASDYERIVASAKVDSYGIVTQQTVKTTDFFLDRNEASGLKDVRHVIIRAKGNTTNNGVDDVKIYDHYRMEFKLGLKGKLGINVNP